MNWPRWSLLSCLLIGGLVTLVMTMGADRTSRTLLAMERVSLTDRSETEPTDKSDKAPAAIPPRRERDDYVRPWRESMHVRLEILVDRRSLPTVRHLGQTYLPVTEWGTEYAIRVWNDGPRRIAALVSVDGLSVINGKTSTNDDPGYVVAPHSSIVIKGWRRNLETVAAFTFEERSKSYASLMGKPENIGIIRLVAIEELVRERPMPFEKDSASGAARAEKKSSTGTGYGRDLDSGAYYVPFARSSNTRTVTLRYDTVAALRKAGVPVDDPEFAPPPPGDHRGD